jgi:hypothetical protein
MMRTLLFGVAGMAAFAVGSPAWANGSPPQVPSVATSFAPSDKDVEVVPQVTPGDQIAIACNALSNSKADSDVRVVLTISAIPGETQPGYQKVLATDAQVAYGAVRVRIPTVPDIADHTVNLDVYVVDDKGSQSCDAGHVKITDSVPFRPLQKTDSEHS